MSHGVSVSVVRKEDYCPMGQFFLGGNSTKRAMSARMIEIKPGLDVRNLGTAKQTIDFLARYDDDLYLGNGINELNEYLYDPNCDEYAYWLVMEY